VTPDQNEASLLEALADGFWDHLWTCWAVLQPQVVALFLILIRRERRWWHWLGLIPLAVIATLLFLLPFVALVAAGTHKFGWRVTGWISDFWAGLAGVLDRQAFPPPKIWQLILLVLVGSFLAYAWKRRNESRIESPEKLPDCRPELGLPQLESNEIETEAVFDGKLNEQVHVAGVQWVDRAAPKPLCPICKRTMSRRPERNASGITVAPVRPNPIILECEQPSCPQGRISTKLINRQLMQQVQDAFNRTT
jgi:hypothetical protein